MGNEHMRLAALLFLLYIVAVSVAYRLGMDNAQCSCKDYKRAVDTANAAIVKAVDCMGMLESGLGLHRLESCEK